MELFVQQFLNLDVMREALPYLLKGLAITIGLTAILAPLGIALGLFFAIASGTKNRAARFTVRTFVNIFRAIPPLVLIILVFSALPFAGIHLPAFPAVVLALALNSSSYYCEIIRAGLNSVPAGQAEAARSTGMTGVQTLRYVVLPQALRNVLPDLASNTIEVVKTTSLAGIIAVGEMLYVAANLRSITYNASPLLLAALLYLAILLPAVRLTSRLEQRPAGH